MNSVGPQTASPSTIYCRHCGYDLRAQSATTSPRCPECGRPFSPSDPKTFRPRPFAAPWKRALARWTQRLAILLLVLILLLAGLWLWLYRGWRQDQAALAELHIGIVTSQAIKGGGAGDWIHGHGVPGSFVLERVTFVCLLGNATDADLLPLRKLPELHVLWLSQTQVTDAGLVHLQPLTQLKELNLQGTKVTPAAKAQLDAALPGCTIFGP